MNLQHLSTHTVKTTGDIVDAWKNAHLTQTPQIPNTINLTLDANATQLIMKMIAKRPEDRYTNWDDVIRRIEVPIAEPKSQSKVASLVQRAVNNYHAAEQERLKQEAEVRRQKEHEEIIAFCFQEIVQTAQAIVDEFNSASEFAKLELRHLPPFSFDIRQERNNTGRVVVTIAPLHNVLKLGNQRIKAWGFAKAPSGRGFNLLLIETNPDDVYGKWITFHAGHHSLMRERDKRQSPFPFEMEELPKEIQLLEVMHAYTIRQDTFKVEIFHPLIDELL